MSFIKNTIKTEEKTEIDYIFKLVKYLKTKDYKKIYFLGVPLIKKNKKEYKKMYILGIPFSYNFYKSKSQGKTITKQVSLLEEKINKIENQCKYIRQLLRISISSNQATLVHPETFGKYRGGFAGKDIVIVACGPTISFYTPQKDAVFIGINRAFKQSNISFDYLFAQDQFLDGMEEINSYRTGDCKKFYGWLGTERIKEVPGVSRISPREFQKAKASMYILEDLAQGNWAVNLSIEPIGDFQGTVFSALQFSCFTMPKRIFLVGCDCSASYFYNQEDQTVFDYQLVSWEKFKTFVSKYYPEIEIISINPDRLRGLFHDVYTKQYLDKHPEIKGVEVFYG